jgi:hypothetical protein
MRLNTSRTIDSIASVFMGYPLKRHAQFLRVFARHHVLGLFNVQNGRFRLVFRPRHLVIQRRDRLRRFAFRVAGGVFANLAIGFQRQQRRLREQFQVRERRQPRWWMTVVPFD